MPLFKAFEKEMTDSKIADVRNLGARPLGRFKHRCSIPEAIHSRPREMETRFLGHTWILQELRGALRPTSWSTTVLLESM